MKDIDLKKIIKLARKPNGYTLRYGSNLKEIKGTILIKIKIFKRVGFKIDLDFPFELLPEHRVKIKDFLVCLLNDIESKGYREELRISKSFIKGAFYLGDEEDVLGFIL